MSKIKYAKENINSINNIFKGKSETNNIINDLGKNVNIFNFSFEDVNKSNLLLNNFISNKNFIDEEFEKNCEDKKEIIKERSKIIVNKIEKNNENDNKKHEKIIEELLQILKNPSHKNIGIFYSPFKPLYQTKKVSLDGKVIINIKNNENKNDRCSI